jgi:deoxyribonuclease-4
MLTNGYLADEDAMKYIGAHVSIKGGVHHAPINAAAIGAKAFGLFTKNQRQWKAKPYSGDEIVQFKNALKESQIKAKHILAHSGYLINLGHPDKGQRQKSYEAFLDEMKRCELLGIQKLNFHPGYHLNQIKEGQCLDYIANALNKVLDESKSVSLVIENTAGQGSVVGYDFEQLAYLIEKTDDKTRIGVCVDTCHLFAAGYDIRTEVAYRKTWKRFSEVIGFDYLKGMHLNDSKGMLGSKRDRHHSIGQGELGIQPFKLIMKDRRMDDIPLILETIDPSLWKQEIELLYSLI